MDRLEEIKQRYSKAPFGVQGNNWTIRELVDYTSQDITWLVQEVEKLRKKESFFGKIQRHYRGS